MSSVRRSIDKGLLVSSCLLLALTHGLAQRAEHKAAASSADATRTILIEKAHALESRGRPDMAIQLWQQILLSEPDNTESLAGMARDLKLIGSDKAIDALDKLRKANPNDPNIAKIEALASTRAETAQLKQAGDLARQGKSDEAMRIYKQLYGDRPPDGDIALAYYQTLYGTANGKQEAIAGMRALAARNPGDPRFAVELGTMLTYEQKTRAEGIRLLRESPKDPSAQTALRQALIWDSANPTSAGELRTYLKEHPQDTELEGRLKEDESKLAQMNSGIARTPAEKAAFAALNGKRLDEAEKRFTEILSADPKNGRVAAGMGFLRMQQNNFGGAISFLSQAEANGYEDRSVSDGLTTSRFWYGMGEASEAFNAGQYDVAQEKYRQALAMRPRSAEALNGLAGLMIKQQQYAAAVPIYEQIARVEPGSTDGWRGLFMAYARDNQNQKAMAVEARFPASVKTALTRDAEYLRTLATIYEAENRNADAERTLAQALALPFPDNGTTLKADTKLEYAGILNEAKRYDQAAGLYAQVLTEDPGNIPAWMGIVNAHHAMGQDQQAIDDVQKMPPATYEAALADVGFLSMLGGIYQEANQYEIAQGLLERAVKMQTASGGQPSVGIELQLAAIYLRRNQTDQAYAIYHRVLETSPDRLDAWKGLIGALQATNRNPEALEEIAAMPATVRKQLEQDIEFVQSEASLYAASGDLTHAIEYMNLVQTHYAKLHTDPPASIEVQNAWLLFNTRNDRQLYPALMQLGGRGDLTAAQRETVEDIWANWSVRRAATAMDNGNIQRAVDILDASSQAFPDNMTVRKAVAGGYAQVGRAREALALFKTVPMQDATAGDFQGAIGAALSAGDKAQAEQWLREALERYPRDASVLSLAARYEQARGDNQRAADYYRASLAAMPSASPTQKLAHVLVYPEQDTRTRRAVTAADLERLLDPNEEPFAKTTRVPPLPAYGSDPYTPAAPVVVAPRRTASARPPASYPAASYPSGNYPSGNYPGVNYPAASYPAGSYTGSVAPASGAATPGYAAPSYAAPNSPAPGSPAAAYPASDNADPAYPAAIPAAQPPAQQAPRQPLTQPSDDDLPLPGVVSPTQSGATDAPVYRPQAWRPQATLAGTRTGNRGPSGARFDGWSARAGRFEATGPRLMTANFQIDRRTRLHLFTSGASNGYVERASYDGKTEVEAARNEVAGGEPQAQTPSQAIHITADAPHSEASDAWKGLIFSLMASGRNAEAIDELNKVPADVRGQLESDVEFEQGMASLYASVGDTQRAAEYMNRVQNYYLLHHLAMPAGLELQHAWMLYNTGADQELYPALQQLDARGDLSADQRAQLQTIWASFAVRRAEYFMNNGSTLRGVQVLQAASENYPNNLAVRTAVAGAYAKVGRPTEALALFKTIPLQDASSGELQGAIGAALGATDMAQAETWLRLALGKYPNDPQILSEAARFEQARGNTQRAADFYRASLAAMPPGAAAAKLDAGLVPQGSYTPPAAGDMKRLLDPRGDPGSDPRTSSGRSSALPPLPTYDSSGGRTQYGANAPPGSVQQTRPPQTRPPLPGSPQANTWTQQPSSNPLPLPATPSIAPTQRQTTPAPYYAPQSSNQPRPLSQPVLVEQSARQPATMQPAAGKTQAGNQVHIRSEANSASDLSPFMGKMNVPTSASTSIAGAAAPVWTPPAATSPNPTPNLRISSQPMGPVAAQAQALFADQVDGQLTQGSASAIHTLRNTPVGPMASVKPGQAGNGSANGQYSNGQYNVAQYTPSAQEAATGAYSAPKQQQQQIEQQPGQQPGQQQPQQQAPLPAQTAPLVCPQGCAPIAVKPRKRRTRRPANQPTLEQAPAEQPYQAPQQVQVPADVPAPAPAPTTDTGLTDEELQQRNLPPLRGPWIRMKRDAIPISPRDEAEMQLRSIESGFSPWLGGAGIINYRTGSLGFDHLAALEAPFEISTPLGYNARLTVVARPVFLDSGQADGTSVITVQETTTSGTSLVTIPQPIGTLTNSALTPPAQQNAVGIGGELQLAFPHLALAGGYTPEGFLVATFTGRAMWKPGNGPLTFNFSRDPVKDTQLSYAGLRDPSGDTLGNQGQIWGGVVANQGNFQIAHGDAESGFYFGGGGQYLTGYQVQQNTRFDGSGGAYWRLKTVPEYGNLSIGANFFGMHYAHNEDAFTHGMGGYFSPQAYFLANVPVTWAGHQGTKWHYTILGSLGVQAFQENLTPLYPLAADEALESSLNNAMLPAKTSVGENYDLRAQTSYQIGPHWFAGGFLSANNSRNYTSVSAGFSIHYMFRAQPSTVTTPTGMFPADGLRPFTVP